MLRKSRACARMVHFALPSIKIAHLTILEGKQWHQPKKAFRPNAGQTSYEKRAAKEKELAVIKAHEKEMKEEKEAERQVRFRPRNPEIPLV